MCCNTIKFTAKHRPKRIWHDTTIKSAREANQLGLSTGVKRESGRGQRVMVLGIGGEEGWIHYEVIKRYNILD